MPGSNERGRRSGRFRLSGDFDDRLVVSKTARLVFEAISRNVGDLAIELRCGPLVECGEAKGGGLADVELVDVSGAQPGPR